MCVCVCVCQEEREEKERNTGGENRWRQVREGKEEERERKYFGPWYAMHVRVML